VTTKNTVETNKLTANLGLGGGFDIFMRGGTLNPILAQKKQSQ
jgi:hypothetical protein